MRAILLTPILVLCVAMCVTADDKPDQPPKVKLPLGKDTTYVTGPFDKYGFIDYEAAINAELSKDVTPDKNAMALLIKAFGPAPEGGDRLPQGYFKWLDIPTLPKEGDYFIGQFKYMRDVLGLTEEQRNDLIEVENRVRKQPWAAKDAPPLAEWIKANEKPLAIVVEAVKRPQYFNPLYSRRKEGDPSSIIGALLPAVQRCREVAGILKLRATLRMSEGKFDDAWQDILTIHRLGRHVGRGATLIEGLVGYAIGAVAADVTITYLAHTDLTAKQALERLKDLQSLPPLPSIADKIDLGERFSGLDGLQLIRRGDNPTAEERKGLESLDWTMMMKKTNQFYDRMSAAMRLKDRAAREKEFGKIESEFEEFAKKRDEAEKKKLVEKVGAKAAASEGVINTLLGLLAPSIRRVQQSEDRTTQFDRNLHVAFALKAYHKDNGRYPAKLADLAPKYLASVPNDLFSGKPLIYKPSEKGYLFYSIGVNGEDDDGHWSDDNPPGDDPRVRMPLPEVKNK